MDADIRLLDTDGRLLGGRSVALTMFEGQGFLAGGAVTVRIARRGVIARIEAYVPALDRTVQLRATDCQRLVDPACTVTLAFTGPVLVVTT